MKKIFIYTAILATVATACSKLDNTPTQEGKDPNEVKMITEKVSGNVDPSSKATIADENAAFSWTEGDNVAVHVTNGVTSKFVFTSDPEAHGASTSGSSASFTVAYEEGYSRNAFAVYPSTIVDADSYNTGTNTLTVTLPSSYALATVTGETTPCPMIATNTGSSWTFKQLCGLLRLTLNGIPSSTSYLKFDFDGKKVQGSFSISSDVTPGTSTIATSATVGTDDIITITDLGISSLTDGLVLNLPLPTGEYTNVTVTAYNSSDEAILTTTRPFAYTASRKKGTKRTVSFPSSKTAFRGYEVSTGILERSVVGSDPATYSLTAGEMIMTYDPVSGEEIYALPAGCNPFEGATYYKQSAALNKYYNKWFTLRDELGANGNNINSTSNKLPAGWIFPSAGGSAHQPGTDWGNILFGAPQSPITVNGETIKKIDSQYYPSFAMVAVTLEAGNGYSVAAGTYYGIFLIRDGLTIPTGYFSNIGLNKYTDNPINETKFNDLIRMGCLFIPAAGYYDGSWRDLSSYYQCGDYWSNSYYSTNSFIRFHFTESKVVSVSTRSTSSQNYYCLVKLVKPVNP